MHGYQLTFNIKENNEKNCIGLSMFVLVVLWSNTGNCIVQFFVLLLCCNAETKWKSE